MKRADELELRQRRELRVHDLDYERNPYSDPERFARDVGLHRGSSFGEMTIDGETVPIETAGPLGRVLSVRGR